MGVTPKRPAAPSKPKDDAINFGSTWESVEAGLKEAKARGWTSLADINGSPEFKDKLYALSFEYNVELLNFTPSANALKLAKKRSKARSGKGNSVLAVLFGIFCGWNFMFTADWIASAIFEEVPVAVYLGSAAAAFIAAFVAWYLKATKTKILLTLLALGGLASIMGFLPSAASLFKSKSAAEAATGTTAEAVVIPDALNLRAEAGGQADVLKTLKKGDTLTINGEPVNGWMPVEHEGVKGFVSSELVKPKE
jgi:acid phosphatase family membrane protein YuiD